MQVSEVITAAGGVKALAVALGIHHSAVIGWRNAGRIPVGRVRDLVRLTGIPQHELRPDIFDPPGGANITGSEVSLLHGGQSEAGPPAILGQILSEKIRDQR